MAIFGDATAPAAPVDGMALSCLSSGSGRFFSKSSLSDPNAYLVPGPSYRQAEGTSVMPKDFATTLTPGQLDDLVAFLLTRR